MHITLLLLDGAGLVVGSIAAAALLCALLWGAFRLVRHPACAAIAVLLLLTLALMGELPHSLFLDMVLVFAVIGAMPLWMAGRTWRREHVPPARQSSALPGMGKRLVRRDPTRWSYPRPTSADAVEASSSRSKPT